MQTVIMPGQTAGRPMLPLTEARWLSIRANPPRSLPAASLLLRSARPARTESTRTVPTRWFPLNQRRTFPLPLRPPESGLMSRSMSITLTLRQPRTTERCFLPALPWNRQSAPNADAAMWPEEPPPHRSNIRMKAILTPKIKRARMLFPWSEIIWIWQCEPAFTQNASLHKGNILTKSRSL